MKSINELFRAREKASITIVQFGEGNFLRAFVDYIFQEIDGGRNEERVAIVKSMPFGDLGGFERQNNLFTVKLEGIKNGVISEKHTVIDIVSEVSDLHKDYASFLSLARGEKVKFIVSNTTEAGIMFDEKDTFEEKKNVSFPAKLTQFLYERFRYFCGAADKGVYLLPCELIDRNADELRRCVLDYIGLWGLPQAFQYWIEHDCYFCNTLVDRIVTGFPKQDAEGCFEKLGYRDELLDIAEPFGLWAIERKGEIEKKADWKRGEEVLFADSIDNYKLRKVRLLNGLHTTLFAAAYLSGFDTVSATVRDEGFFKFMQDAAEKEIIPTIPLPEDEIKFYMASVFERFANPFLNHLWLSIALNAVSKWRTRVLPTVKDIFVATGKAPERLLFGLAALLKFYRGGMLTGGVLQTKNCGRKYEVKDGESEMKFFAEISALPEREYALVALKNDRLWGEDLSHGVIGETTLGYYLELTEKSPEEVMKRWTAR